MKFKIGDRVRATNDHFHKVIIGKKGTVKEVCKGYQPILVEFDEAFKGGHNGLKIHNKSCKNKHGRWMPEEWLEKINKCDLEHIESIFSYEVTWNKL